MHKSAMAKLVESMVEAIAVASNCDAATARAFLGHAMRSKQAELVAAACPTPAIGGPRVGPDGHATAVA